MRASAHPRLALAVALALALLPAAAAAREPAPVEVGRVGLALPAQGRGALLMPVRYPIELAGQRIELRVSLRRPGGAAFGGWTDRTRANSGPLRAPERRRAFGFVHRIDLSPRITRLLRRRGARRLLVVTTASAVLDVNRDGDPEIVRVERRRRPLTLRHAGRLCSTVPLLRTAPGRTVGARLPACGLRMRWRIVGAQRGRARIRNGSLLYRPGRRFHGAESLQLRGRPRGASASVRPVVAPVEIRVRARGVSVRALGDSVTAGFGYYDDGKQMQFEDLLSCRPPAKGYDDACSSNSTVRDNDVPKVEYAPDYGLSNNVSWAAQWANAHGISNYANYAVSGSEPKDWAPGGQFYDTTRRLEGEDPDYVVLTMGANPLLSDMLFGIDNMGCAIESDILGGYRECIEKAFAEVKLRQNLEALYTELVKNTAATIYLMHYHLSVPASALAYSATQIAMMGALLNGEISAAAGAVGSPRLRVVEPPHFNVGVDISPVYPSTYSCSDFGFLVDGRSVQSTPSQDELLIDHPLSFCSGPAGGGPPWVISGDTGIHPSATGYGKMAARLPAPR